MIDIYFCLKVALILVVFGLCFWFRRENGRSADASEKQQDKQ